MVSNKQGLINKKVTCFKKQFLPSGAVQLYMNLKIRTPIMTEKILKLQSQGNYYVLCVSNSK